MNKLILALCLCVFPAFAIAAPALVAIGFSAATAANIVIVAQIAFTIGSMLYGSAQQKKAERNARKAERARISEYNAGLKDRTITQIATEAPHRYVYGRARVGSDIVAIFTSGDRDQYKHLVCIHAAHECDGFEDIYIAGQKLAALDGNGWVTGAPFFKTDTFSITQNITSRPFTLAHTPVGPVTVVRDVLFEGRTQKFSFPITVDPGNVVNTSSGSVTYQYIVNTPYVNVRKHLGTPTDPVDPYLNAVTGGAWASSSVLRDKCYTVITLNLDEPEFQGGIPSIEVVLRGKKLFDPRVGYAYWNQNPALVTNDYLRSEICGVAAADIPLASLITAANTCDEAQSFGPRYVFNGAITSDQGQSNVLERMAQSMAGGIVSTTWDIYAGKYVAPVLALDQKDIVGDIAITPGVSDADIYNGVRGQYISAENDYVPTDFKPYQNPVYVASDTRELWTDIDFPFTDNVQRVWNLARIFTEDQRNGYTVKASFSLKAWSLKVGQRVTLTSSLFGWNAKVFRVTDKSYSPSSPVELTLKEDDPSIWDFADAVTADSTPNTNLPNPFAIDKIASVTCESGSEYLIAKDGAIISRILVTWPQATTQSVLSNGTVEIEWQLVGSDVWNKVSVSGDDTQTYISPAEDEAFYTVRVRPTIPSLGVKADWTYADLHQVIGKTAKPADMESLSISGSILNWVPNIELDLKGYVFRFHYGNNLDWGSAVPLHEGVITESPFDLVTRPSGVVTIMGKVLDTSGNYSNATANIVTNLGDAPIANIVEQIDFHADSFPGTFLSCSIDVNGDLVADASDSFYGTDNQSAYGLASDSFYKEESYAQMIYTTNEISTSAGLADSVITLEVEYQGTDLYFEYRLAQPGSAYGDDGESAYGPDDAPFYDSEPGAWLPWPGQIMAASDVYQFRVAIGAGATQGKITSMVLTIDAPDIVEYLEDVAVTDIGTVVPYTKNFHVIKTVSPTLQANSSGAETVEVDKSINLAPVLRAFNSSHVAVSGATTDVILKGY